MLGHSYFSRSVCGASRTRGKCFAPNAVPLSHGLEGIGRPPIQLLILFKQHNRDHLEIQTHSEISRSAICNDDNSDSGEDHEQQKCLLRSDV